MKQLIKLLTLSFCFFPLSSFATPISKVTDLAIQQLMQKDHIPGMAVELYVDGKMYSDYTGYANLATKQRINSHTIFELGSITKIFTSLVLAEQVEKNIVRLNSPVSHFMKTAQFRGITLKNLATHTAGFPSNPPAQIQNTEDFSHYLADYQPTYTPGSTWIYSNFSFGVLGEALENITHENISQMYRQDILAPLHMTSTEMVVTSDDQKNYAQGYSDNNEPVAPMMLGATPSAYAIKASGDDMQQFLKAALLLPNTPKTIANAMQLTETPYYSVANSNMLQGLGWEILAVPKNAGTLLNTTTMYTPGAFPVKVFTHYAVNNQTLLINKTGFTRGFSAYIAIIPKYHAGIVILANQSVTNGDMVNTARQLLFKLTGIQ